MAEVKREVPMVQNEDTVSISRGALVDMLKTILEEAKKPYDDPEMIERKARNRERLRNERQRSEKEKLSRQSRCSHLREDGTSAIAWATQSDCVTRGVCQHCNRLIIPTDADYGTLIRIPDRAPGVIHI